MEVGFSLTEAWAKSSKLISDKFRRPNSKVRSYNAIVLRTNKYKDTATSRIIANCEDERMMKRMRMKMRKKKDCVSAK